MEEFVIRLTDDFKAGLDMATSGGGGGGGSASAGSAAGFGAKIGAGIAIAMELLNVVSDAVGSLIRPINSVLKGIFRIIGELFRPISDMVVMLLQPVLIMLKPFLDMLRTFMAPFMEVARELGNMAKEQMAQGNTAGAMSLSVEAMNTVIGPFVVSLVSVGMQLLTTTLVSAIGGLLGLIFPKFQSQIEEGANSVAEWTNDKLNTTTQYILDGMLSDAQERLAAARDRFPAEFNDIMIETPAGMLAEMAKTVEADSKAMDTNMTAGMAAMDTSILDTFGSETGTGTTTFRTGLDAMTSAIRTFTAKVQAYAEDINDIKLRANKEKEDDDGFSVSIGPFGFRKY